MSGGFQLDTTSYDVAVVGGGHAACEAALAAARMGAKTILFTINLDHIAQMSCNPAIGGIAKGHVVREIDAMGGAMGSVTDAAALQFRMLNMAKGPAVWSPRAQCDKYCYHQCMKRVLELQENLTIRNATVMNFLLEDGKITGVEAFPGGAVHTKAVVVATGTFLNGKMHYGLKNMSGGRSGDPASIELAEALRHQLGLKVGRLKTGTPPRILGSSIDFSKMGIQNTDVMEEHFSYFPPLENGFKVQERHFPCRTVYTTEETAKVVQENLHQAPMYSGIIEGIGTRYCPSFEDKVVRFAHHPKHLLYIEPEGENTDEFYINGISTSLPPDVQIKMLRTIPGLENVQIARFAYAIEYDFVHPEEIHRGLGVKRYPGLFLAGQINGTSGYEEAAGQGLVAGMNAARFAAGKDHVEIGRDEAYIGVMIDDLVTKEIVEPYRLFTSRAEYRLNLRQDNADLRLSKKAYEWGVLPEEKYRMIQEYSDLCDKTELLAKSIKKSGYSLYDALRDRHGDLDFKSNPVDYQALELDENNAMHRRVMRQLVIRSHYAGYLRQEGRAVEKLHSLESWKIPESFDYAVVTGLRNESRQKLEKTRPTTLAQAGRIDGVTSYELGLLQVFLSRDLQKKERGT